MMRFSPSLISFIIITMFVGLGSLVLSTDQVQAQDTCQMTIVKVADPADDTEFNFSVAGGNVFVETVSDPSNPSFTFDLVDGNPATTVTEEVPSGWILDHIDCTTPNIGCGPGGLKPCLIITAVPNGLIFECLDVLGGPNTCTFSMIG